MTREKAVRARFMIGQWGSEGSTDQIGRQIHYRSGMEEKEVCMQTRDIERRGCMTLEDAVKL